jgi:outer membrane receptor protein involved in Fe transport
MKRRFGTRRFGIQTLLLGASALAVSLPALAADENDEIVVTAQKRAQDIRDVPIALTAVSGEDLTMGGVVDVNSLGMVAPTLRITTSTSESFGSVVRIRGVGTSGSNAGLEGSVGIFVDGVYVSRTGIAMSDLVDVERIEVLRGAQGTLFGKNTSAGAIQIITKKPEFEFGGTAEVSISNYEGRKLRGSVTGPIVDDNLAVRLSGTYNMRDGFITDVNSGLDFNDRDRFILRGQALLTPNDNFQARLIVDYSEKDESCCASPFSINGPASNLFLALGGTVPPDDEFERLVAVNDPYTNASESFGASVEMNWDTSFGSVTSITSYRDYQARSRADTDRRDIDLAENNNDFSTDVFSQELRLQGEKGAIDWMVGAYYFNEDTTQESSILWGSQAGNYFSLLVPAGLRPLVSSLYPEGTGAVSNNINQSTTGWSVFTHNVISISPRVSAVLGLRLSTEDKEASGRFVANTPACTTFGPASPLAGLRILCSVPDYDVKTDYSEPTGTFKLQFAATEEVNTYASYSHGFKAGGISFDRNAGTSASGPEFLPETVDTFEVGAKGKFMNGAVRLNVAAYYSDFKNLQLNTFDGIQFSITNEPGVISQGVEVDGFLLPGNGWFLNGSVAYNDSTYKDTSTPNLAGKQLVNAPSWTLGGAIGTTQPISNNLEMFGRLNVSHNSGMNTGSNLAPEKFQQAYTRVNARLGIRSQDKRWELSAWARNLFDENYSLIIINTPIQSGSFNAFTGSPRTWGLTLRGQF